MHWISLFSTVKTAALYLVPIKSYSKNTHPPSFLEWAVLGNGDGTFSNYTTYLCGLVPYSILSADLNNDGKIDIAVINVDGVTILFGMENGTFGNQIIYAPSRSVLSFTGGAFRDKTKLDLMVTNADENNISILLNSCP
jgi:hypothetical protein